MFEWNPGAQVRQARAALGFSQRHVAANAGLAIKTVREVERTAGTVSSFLKAVEALDQDLVVHSNRKRRDLGQCLAEKRSTRGITQVEAASSIGVSLPTIIALEKRMVGRIATLVRYVGFLDIRPRLIARRRSKASGRRLAPETNQPSQDIVMTPPRLAAAIVRHFQPTGIVLDPFRGDRAFYDALPKEVEAHWCEVREGRDFLDWDAPVDWIISNPPWSTMRVMLIAAMTSSASDIVFLSALNQHSTKARMADRRKYGFGLRSFVLCPEPKEDWPRSGFQLGAAHLQRGWTGPCEFVDRIDAWRHTVEIEDQNRAA